MAKTEYSYIETSVVTEVMTELEKAMSKHPTGMRSIHEGYAILKEEVDELWDEIKKHKPCSPCIRKECVQVAAMALRFLLDLKPGQEAEEPIDPLYEAAHALAFQDSVPVQTVYDAMKTAVETNTPQFYARPNGTRRLILPTETNKIVVERPIGTAPDLYAPYGEVKPLQTAPMPDTVDEELHAVALANDALGG